MGQWNQESIHALLDAKPRAVERAIVQIYRRQTSDERSTKHTRHTNGVGFSKWDAEILTSFAEQLLRGRTLSPKQLAIGRNKMKRYWRQLAEIANQRASDSGAVESVSPSAVPVEAPMRKVRGVPHDCTCAEHEWCDGEDTCAACQREGIFAGPNADDRRAAWEVEQLHDPAVEGITGSW